MAKKSKLNLINDDLTWNADRRYKVNSVVQLNGEDYQNITGKNSNPELLIDWQKIYTDIAISDVTGLPMALDYLQLNKEDKANKNIANGYAGLDSSGKIIPTQLPALAITDTFVVASQAEMLALVAEVGDVAVRTDLNKSFILRVTGASTLANWQELLSTTSVDQTIIDGSTNAVSGNAVFDALATKANDSNVIHTTGNESKNAPLNFTYPIGSIANSPLTIKNYGGVFGANNDIPVELIKLSYAGLFSMNYKYQPDEFGVAYVPYDTTFPMHSFEVGREGMSVHGMAEDSPEGSSDNNLDDRMVWKAGARGVRTTAPNSLVTDAGTWIQNFTGVYAENINDPLKWSSGASNSTPFEYYRKQGDSSTPSFLHELSGDNNSPLSSVYRKSRGTLLTPTATIAGDSIYLLKGQVYDGAKFEDATFIRFSALGNATGSNSSGKIVLGGAKTGTTFLTDWVSIDNGDMNVDRSLRAKDVQTVLDTQNDITGRLKATVTEVQLSSSYDTTGSFVPLKFYTSDTERMSISTSGIVNFAQIPTAPTAPAGTNTTQVATTAFVQAAARPYKVYTANLFCSGGTNASLSQIIGENTLGVGNPTISTVSQGTYDITFPSAIAPSTQKIFLFGQKSANQSIGLVQISTSVIRVTLDINYGSITYLSSTSHTIEIRVYN